MADIRIRPWSPADLALLQRINAPEMTEHLGGPETDQQVITRHRRYLAGVEAGGGQMYVVLFDGDPAGSVGFWDKEWRGETVHEMGWSVLPEFQGRGIAVAAAQATIEVARAERRRRYVHAFPSVDNPPSNAVCRRLGFDLLGECDVEYPPGHPMRCNDWQFELSAA